MDEFSHPNTLIIFTKKAKNKNAPFGAFIKFTYHP